MPQGDKSKYTAKQKRKAEHIEEGYEERGIAPRVAKARAWATVNKESGGGNLSGSGRGVPDTNVSARRGGRIGGQAAASRPPSARSRSAEKAAETRKRNASGKSSAGSRSRATTTRSSARRKPRARLSAGPR